MLRVNEVGILTVNVKHVFQHAQHKGGNSKHLGERTKPQLGGDSNEQRDRQYAKEHPPLLAPVGDEQRHQDGYATQEHDEDGTGDERLLYGLVDEIDVAVDDGTRNLRQLIEQTLDLRRHPPHTLALEIVLTAHFLIEDMDVGGILDKHLLTQQQGLHLAVLACSSKQKDVFTEQLIVETHTGTDEC